MSLLGQPSSLVEAGFGNDVGSSRSMNIMEWPEFRCVHRSTISRNQTARLPVWQLHERVMFYTTHSVQLPILTLFDDYHTPILSSPDFRNTLLLPAPTPRAQTTNPGMISSEHKPPIHHTSRTKKSSLRLSVRTTGSTTPADVVIAVQAFPTCLVFGSALLVVSKMCNDRLTTG